MKLDRWRRTRPLAPASSPDGGATYGSVDNHFRNARVEVADDEP
jgi:hypothetical protein